MNDFSFIILDIEIEFKKYHDSLKKKYSKIKESSEISLKTIDSLKAIIPNKGDENASENFKTELNKSIALLLKPIYLVIENKYIKIYLSSLSLLKKFVIYNLINDIEYNNIINYLKDIFSTQNEDIQLKVLEILQYIINGNVTKLTDININNIMDICKIDNIKGHTKFSECKNAIKLILNILTKKIFDVTEEKNVLQFIQNLLSSIEGNQKEWSSMNLNNSLAKSIRFEYICSILETFPEKFREGESKKFLENNLNTFIKKIFQINSDQLIGIKLCRLTMIIVTIVNENHLLLEEILKYLNKNNQIKWQKTIGLEVLSELFKKPEILFNIYLTNNDLYQKIFQTFINTTYNTIILKSQKINDKKNQSTSAQSNNISNKKQNEHHPELVIPNKKYILNNNIFINENDQIIIITVNNEYIFKLLADCYIYIKNSYLFLLENNGININIISSSKEVNDENKNIKNEKQEKLKEMINSNFVDFKGGLIGMLLHINEVGLVQSFISIFQSLIYIFNSFGLNSSKNELLNDLCQLAIPNNLQNILEIKEKNISIIRTLFNLSHCTNLLEKNSWIIFVQAVQNLYFILIKSGYYLYNDKQQFNIDVIMKNIESNIKKYSAESSISEVQKVVQEDELNKNINTISTINKGGHNKEMKNKKGKGLIPTPNIRILTSEEKENIDILSNLVNNLFTDSNDYDDITLSCIINALYEDIEKKITFYNKQLKFMYDKNTSLTESKRKNSEGDIQNMQDKKDNNIIQNKKMTGKQTARNDIFKSVMDNRVIGDLKNAIPGIMGFNYNFQNEKISMNLSNINFNLVKIFGIVIINIKRINLLWDKILSLIKLFAFEINEENNYSNTLFKFTIDLLGYIIITILIKCDKKMEEKEEFFNNKNLQINLFNPFINLLNGYYNNFHINSNYMINPFKKIIEKCGTKLNIYGWNQFFNGLNLILINKKSNINSEDKELLFKIIEEIFNEYSDYLSIFNVEILLDVLEQFSINSENKNICYSSISFFWQCANIIDNYQKNKKELNGLELELYKEKCSNDETKITFYENLWKKLFNKLITINNDQRFDIKKSGINIFSQFFVAKIKSINEINDISTEIMNSTFFKIFNDNIQSFIDNIEDNKIEKDKIINNNEKNAQQTLSENNTGNGDDTSSNDAKEEIVLLSLQSMGKVIRAFIEENKNNENTKKNQLIIIQKLVSIYLGLIEKKNTPQITVNILKNVGEFEIADKSFFHENRDIFWNIIEKIVDYTENKELFIEQFYKSIKAIKVVQSIIDSLMSNFYSKDDIEVLNNKKSINNNIDSFLVIIKKLSKSSTIMEKTLIGLDPFNIITIEKNIFNLIETIGSYLNSLNDIQKIINYLLEIINYNKEDKHSIAISGQSLKSLGIILQNNNNLLNDLEEEKIKKIIMECKNKISVFYEIKKDKTLESELLDHNIKKKDIFVWEKMIIIFNDYILKSFIAKLKDEKIWEEILNYLVEIYKEVREESNIIKNNKMNIVFTNKEEEKKEKGEEKIKDNIIENEVKNNVEDNNMKTETKNNEESNKNKEEELNNGLIKSNKEIEKNIINFVINILLPNAGYISNNIQQKLLKLLDIESNKEEKNEKTDNNNSNKLFSIKEMNLENLFNVCNFKNESELQKEFNNKNNNDKEKLDGINKYIEIKKNISQLFLPVLFKTCRDKIDEYIENEKKEGNNNNLKEEIILILDGLKNLDSYCSELNDLPKNEIMKNCANNKKGHLFILHHYFNKLILSRSDEIKKKIYEIFEVIANQMDE